MRFLYTEGRSICVFRKNYIYPKIIRKKENSNTSYLIVDDRGLYYLLRPNFNFLYFNKIDKIRKIYFRFPRKRKEEKNLIKIYSDYISDVFACDFQKLNFSLKSLRILKYVEKVLEKMNVDKELFINYSFFVCKGRPFPYPEGLRLSLKTFNLEYRKSFFPLRDKVRSILENRTSDDFYPELDPEFIVFASHPIIIDKIKNLDFEQNEFWKKILVGFLILKNYTEIRSLIFRSSFYSLFKKREDI